MTEDIRAARKMVQDFIRGPDRYLKVPYDGPELNPREYWHKIVLQSRIRLLRQSLVSFVCTIPSSGEFKNRLLRSNGMNIGKDAFIAPLVFMDIEFPSLLTIGDGAVVGTMTKILTHEVTIKRVRLGKTEIGKQALVGAGSVIRCGVTIGEGAVVAMNSFVNRDVPPFQVVGGGPLQAVKKLDKLIAAGRVRPA